MADLTSGIDLDSQENNENINWLNLFTISSNVNKASCQICSKQFDSVVKSNLKVHLVNDHNETARRYNCVIKKRSHPNVKRNVTNTPKKPKKLDPGSYIKICVQLVAINLVAMAVLNYPAFRQLTEIHAFDAKMQINSTNIGGYIEKTADQIRSIIKNEVHGRLISLKLDVASRYGKSVLGINVQYFNLSERKIAIRTLGVIELKKRHTSSYLQSRVNEVLELYGIDQRNIYTFTSDNGANMIKLGKFS